MIGCGEIGNELGRQFDSQYYQLAGLRRNTAALDARVGALAGDYTDAQSLRSALVQYKPDCLILTLTPSEYSEQGYRSRYTVGVENTLLAMRTHCPKHLFFVSSTSVYAQSNGEWVDESSATQPSGFSGRVMLDCEARLLSADVPATMLRCGGIYGGHSQGLLERVRQGRLSESEAYSNRIHLQDCASAITHLVEHAVAAKPLHDRYLLVDNEPCRKKELEAWLANELEVEARITAKPSRMAGSKRCSNRRLRASGFECRYPSYREGYREILARSRCP